MALTVHLDGETERLFAERARAQGKTAEQLAEETIRASVAPPSRFRATAERIEQIIRANGNVNATALDKRFAYEDE